MLEYKKSNTKLFLFIFSIIFLFSIQNLSAQTEAFSPSGTPLFKVYTNYHYEMTPGASKRSAFELKRVYFGYKYQFSPDFSARLNIDVGDNKSSSAYAAYIKYAYLNWQSTQWLAFSVGMIEIWQHKTQESWWGHRYVYKSFQDEHGMSHSADLGLNADIKLHEKAHLNLTVSNGEGYKKIQDNFGKLRYSADLELEPVKGLWIKIYADQMGSGASIVDPADTSKTIALLTQQSLSTFAGYRKKGAYSIGIEYDLQNKHANMPQENMTGFSFFGSYNLNSTWELFGRFDILQSNTITGQTESWNIKNDGNLIMAGVQYQPVKGVSMALNYRMWNYTKASLTDKSGVYINFEYKL